MKEMDKHQYISLKYACALNKSLIINKKVHERNKRVGIEDLKLTHSYDTISSDTGIRGAAISNIFNGKSDAKISSIDLILKSMSFSNSKFGKILDNLTEEEVRKFKEIKKDK